MRTCPACAEEVTREDRFCPYCDEELPPPGPRKRKRSRPSQGLGEDATARMLLPVGRSGWAIAAGYLGLFSLLCCPAPFALIIGVIAVMDIKKNPQRHGMGRAVFGIIMGTLGTIAMGFYVIGMITGNIR
ncbi:MAG: hypothetical protein CMJ78_11895 [Planctomycetaceae bacterium]|nr:hypothetical protein [Planctomycetaceae bacterium]